MIHRSEKWTGKQWHKPMTVWRHKTSLGSLLARKSFWVSRPGADGRVSRPSRRTWLMLIDADSQSNNCFIVCSSIGSHLCFFSSLLSLPSLAPTQTNQAIRCDYRSRPTALDTSSEIWRHQTLSAQPSATSGLDATHWAQSVKSLPNDLLYCHWQKQHALVVSGYWWASAYHMLTTKNLDLCIHPRISWKMAGE